MKKAFLLLACICLAILVFAQGTNTVVPSEVKSAFEKNFKGSSHVKWEKEGDEFEVNFKMGGKTMSAVYDAKAALKETEEDINISALPVAIATYVKDHYKDATIKEAAKITRANGEVNFEAEVNKTDLIFDSNGKFLKKEKG